MVGSAIVLCVVLTALVGPLVVRRSPIEPDFVHGLGPLGDPVGPNRRFFLGTDRMGRDQLARIVHGARVSLAIGALATALSLVIGMGVGIVAGYFRGWADAALMRLVDMILAFPFLLLVIALSAVLDPSQRGMTTVLLVLGLTAWTGTARLIRGKALTIREMDYVTSARALGASHLGILARHVLPNVLGPAIVIATVSVAQMIVAEAVLSYLSLGVPPPQASWGSMLHDGQAYYRVAPMLIAAPGIAIVLTVLGFNLLGEGLRDALDPKN